MKNINKKGFTLVELLSVIVILSVIVLIATNAVVPMADSARKQVLAMEANTLVTAAQTLYVQNNASGSACYTYDELINSGLIEKDDESYTGSISIEVDGSGNYSYKIWLSNGQYIVNGVSPDVTSDNVEASAESASTVCGVN